MNPEVTGQTPRNIRRHRRLIRMVPTVLITETTGTQFNCFHFTLMTSEYLTSDNCIAVLLPTFYVWLLLIKVFKDVGCDLRCFVVGSR